MKNIHIIGGTGKMGKWLSTFLQKNDYSVTISGSKNTQNNADISKADCVIFAIPITMALTLIKELAPQVKNDCLIIDLSSVTTPNVEVLKETGLPSLAMHCMFGPSILTLANQKIVFIEVKSHPLIEKLKKLFLDNQATVLTMTAKEHDTTTAYIQALIHFINLMLAETLAPEYPLRVTTPAFITQYALISRVLSNNSAELLTQIQLYNPYFQPILKQFIERQQYVLSLLEQKKEKELKTHYAKIQTKSKPEQKREPVIAKEHILPQILQAENISVGYLGPEGTYSHQAAEQMFKIHSSHLVPYRDIYRIFEDVASKKLAVGVVPAENSTEGMIRETLDYLVDFDLCINGSIDLPIHHSLLAKEETLERITKVIAHPQSLAQCRKWLMKNIPTAKLETATSNTVGIDTIEKENGVAIIASHQAASRYTLNILAENIQDNPNNTTRFYIISREKVYDGAQSTLLFLTVLNRVGVLRDILNVFGDFGINLNKIESRPSREKNWDYYFFVEIDISPSDPITTRALDLLRQYCQTIQILGGI